MNHKIKTYLALLPLSLLVACATSGGIQEIKKPVYNSYDTSDYLVESHHPLIPAAYRISGNKGGFSHTIYKVNEAGKEGYHGHISNDRTKDLWDFRCDADSISDKNDCYISRSGNDITKFMLHRLDSKHGTLCIGYHDFPNRPSVIRIDNQNPINIASSNNGCMRLNSKNMQKLKQASSITIRGFDWPYDYPQDQKIGMGGFTEALSIAQWVRTNKAVLDGLLK